MSLDIRVEYFRGEDKTLNCTVYKADGTTIQDISGWVILFVIRKRKEGESALLLSKAVSVTDGPNGLCSVIVSDSEIDALKSGTYFCGFKRTDGAGETILGLGPFVLKQAPFPT